MSHNTRASPGLGGPFGTLTATSENDGLVPIVLPQDSRSTHGGLSESWKRLTEQGH